MTLTIFIILAISGSALLLLYVGSNFRYVVEEDALVLRWHLPFGIPFWRWRIALDRIAGVRSFEARDLFRNAVVFGRLPSRRALILELGSGRFRRVYVSPEHVETLRAQLPTGPFD